MKRLIIILMLLMVVGLIATAQAAMASSEYVVNPTINANAGDTVYVVVNACVSPISANTYRTIYYTVTAESGSGWGSFDLSGNAGGSSGGSDYYFYVPVTIPGTVTDGATCEFALYATGDQYQLAIGNPSACTITVSSDNPDVTPTPVPTALPPGGTVIGGGATGSAESVYYVIGQSPSIHLIGVNASTMIPLDGIPVGVAANPAGTTVYVTDFTNGHIDVVDLNTLTVSKNITLPGQPVGKITLNGVGDHLYTGCIVSTDYHVVGVNTITGAVFMDVNMGSDNTPAALALNSKESELWVAYNAYSTSTAKIGVVNVTNHSIDQTITIGVNNNSYSVAYVPYLVPKGDYFVVAYSGGVQLYGGHALVNTYPSSGLTAWVSVQGDRVFASMPGENNITVLSIDYTSPALSLVNKFTVGKTWSISSDDTGNYAFAADKANNTVLLTNGTTTYRYGSVVAPNTVVRGYWNPNNMPPTPMVVTIHVHCLMMSVSGLTLSIYNPDGTLKFTGVTGENGQVTPNLFYGVQYRMDISGDIGWLGSVHKSVYITPDSNYIDIGILPWVDGNNANSTGKAEGDIILTGWGERNGNFDYSLFINYTDMSQSTTSVDYAVYAVNEEDPANQTYLWTVNVPAYDNGLHANTSIHVAEYGYYDFNVTVTAHTTSYGDVVRSSPFSFPRVPMQIPGAATSWYMYLAIGLAVAGILLASATTKDYMFVVVAFAMAGMAVLGWVNPILPAWGVASLAIFTLGAGNRIREFIWGST